MAMMSSATTISIRRTISTAPYESVVVELTETYPKMDRNTKTETYKAQSELVEKMANFEAKKYGRAEKRK